MVPSDIDPSDQRPADEDARTPAPPPKRRAKTTIMDLARYRVGQRAYWIVFRAERRPEFEWAEDWMRREHPWVLWRHKIVPWSVPMKPPRVHPIDTMAIMMLCSQKPKIEPFRIADVARSTNSGTFLYTGPKGIVMPEGLLFPTKAAARKEIARIARVFAAWISSWEEKTNSPPKSE